MNKQLTIMCCCGNGLGSSLIVSLNLANIINDHNLTNIKVDHTSLSGVSPASADIFVIGLDIVPLLKDYPHVIVVKDLISYEELEEKLLKALSYDEDSTYFLV